MEKKELAPSRKKKYSAPALEKGLDILELLALESEGLSIGAITKRLDKSVGELFRMLVVLEQRGYVAVIPGTDSYTLTLKLFELSHHFPPTKRLTSAATPILKRLAFEIEQSCHLVIYYEGRGRVVVQQDSPSERVISVRLGADAPLVNTCSGHVLLAFAEESERDRMLASIPKYHQKPHWTELSDRLERVRNRGYESIESAQIQGVLDIGLPIYDHSGSVVAALVVPFLAYLDGTHPVSADKARERLTLSAHAISSALGHKN
ncbi:MAG: DNA-binding IclR family transcriptional regulator [Arenicella sp.]|jgi:DNA-binding IclR family transcriptional regulator